MEPELNPLIDALRAQGAMPVRLRWYEMSRPGGVVAPPSDGDPVFRQTGVKTWSDGSPWVGNIATSFPYLDTPATRSLGLEPHHIGTRELHGRTAARDRRTLCRRGLAARLPCAR